MLWYKKINRENVTEISIYLSDIIDDYIAKRKSKLVKIL